MTHAANLKRPALWAIILAFACLYTAWGTTYLAIREGVKTLPPALFGGTRLAAAGLVLLAFLAVRGQRLRLARRELFDAAIVGVCLFVVGNGLITFAEKSVPSIITAVLVATTPIWFALLEALWPWGERLTVRGWLGLALGLGGVLVLMAPELMRIDHFFEDLGPLLILTSAISWAVGSFILRHRKRSHRGSHLLSAAYQMLIGGTLLTLVGLAAGETRDVTPAIFTPTAVFSFFYLLVVGSLVGFVAYNYLLGHVSGALVGTYAYVNPVVAILVGWQLGHEELSPWILGGVAVILAGVALVRIGGVRPARARINPVERPESVSDRSSVAVPTGG
jgi:drug/metabolite transporter (DMT)-like permease